MPKIHRYNCNLIIVCPQTGCWIDVTVIWNGRVQWKQSERRSMLPSRTCQRARRSSSFSQAPVGPSQPQTEHLFLIISCYLSLSPFVWILQSCRTYLPFMYLFSLIDIHYFHCLRIVEILKGTEASSKNIFGRYSSQRMKVRGVKQASVVCLIVSHMFIISVLNQVVWGDFLHHVPLLLKLLQWP